MNQHQFDVSALHMGKQTLRFAHVDSKNASYSFIFNLGSYVMKPLFALSLVVIISLGVFFTNNLQAATWTGTGNWTENPGNWAGGIPTAANPAIITSGMVTIDSSSISSAPVAATLDVNGATLNMSDKSLTIGGLTRIGQSGIATVNQSGGNVLIGGTFDMNNAGTGNGSIYTFTGGTFGFSGSGSFTIGRTATFTHNTPGHTLTVPGNMAIGNVGAGDAVFNLDAGAVDIKGNLILGENQNNTGTFNFGAGTTLTLTGASSTFNMKGTSLFTLNAGQSLSSPTNVQVGSGTGSSVFNLSGGTLTIATDLDISQNGDNTFLDEFNFTSGSIVFGGGPASDVRIGRTGTFTYDRAGTFVIPGTLTVGNIGAGTATFDILQGGVDVKGDVVLAENQNNFGTINVSPGAGLTLTGASSTFNMKGTSLFTLNVGQSLSSPTNVQVGSGTGSSVFNLSGGTLTIATDLDISQNGDNTFLDEFNLNSGSITFTGGAASDLRIGRTGEFNHNKNGVTLVPGNVQIGNIGAGTATMNLNAGTLDVNGNVTLGTNVNNTGTLNVAAGATLKVNGSSDLVLTSNTAVNSAGQILLADTLLLGNAAGTSVFTQTDGLVKVGSNLTISTIAANTGTYNLNGGSLNVLGTLNLNGNPGTATLNLNGGKFSTALLQTGSDTFSYTGGLLSPGLLNTPATMMFNGNLLMPAAGGLEMDLAAPEMLGGLNDLLVVNGDLQLDGILSVNSVTGTFPIITFTGNLTGPGLSVLFPLTQSVFVEFNEGGGGTVFLQVLPVPEPSSLMLLVGLGLVGLNARRPERKSQV